MDKKLLLIIAASLILFIITRLFRKKKGWYTFLTVCLSILVTLIVIECVYRFLIKKESYVIHSSQSFGTYQYNSLTGYTLANTGSIDQTKMTLYGDTIYSTTYNVIPDSGQYNLGLNHRKGYFTPENDSSQLIFLGCSITFGDGIHDGETFAAQTGELCHTSSVNLGLSGYGTHQAYQIYQHAYRQKKDSVKRIFVYSFIPDHILRAKCVYPWNSDDPYFAVDGDSLKLLGRACEVTSYARWNKFARYMSLLYTFTFISDLEANIEINNASKNIGEPDYQRVFLMLKKMESEIRNRGDRFIILYWDKYKWRKSDDEKVLSRKRIDNGFAQLAREGVEVLPVSNMININDSTLFITGDGHPNARANRMIAEALAKAIQQP